MHRATRLAIVLTALLAPAGGALGRVFMTQEQALTGAFPAPQTVDRHTLYLDEDQVAAAAERAGVPVEGRVVSYYVGSQDGRVTGYAYFDTHLVRTLPETIMVLISTAGRIRRIDILSFDEPEDYKLSPRFLGQFREQGMGPDLSLKGKIRGMTGATLSARAVTEAARRVLAVHTLFVAPSTGDTPRAGGVGVKP